MLGELCYLHFFSTFLWKVFGSSAGLVKGA